MQYRPFVAAVLLGLMVVCSAQELIKKFEDETNISILARQLNPSTLTPASRVRQKSKEHHYVISNRDRLPSVSGLSFATAVPYPSGGQDGYWVTTADVNGDGKIDALVVNQCEAGSGCETDGSVGVLLGNGDGTFQEAAAYDSGGHGALSVAVADVNGDGRPDVLVSNQCGMDDVDCLNRTNGNVGVLLGNGDGTFQAAVTYDSGGYQATTLAFADVNGDGKTDIVLANDCENPNSCNVGSIGVLFGNGDGTFDSPVNYGSGGYGPFGMALADLNGDGNVDLVVANACAAGGECGTTKNGTVAVLLGNGDGTFNTPVNYNAGGIGTVGVAAADVNGDGKVDLIVASDCNVSCGNGGVLGVLLGNGDGTFQLPVSYGTGGGGDHNRWL